MDVIAAGAALAGNPLPDTLPKTLPDSLEKRLYLLIRTLNEAEIADKSIDIVAPRTGGPGRTARPASGGGLGRFRRTGRPKRFRRRTGHVVHGPQRRRETRKPHERVRPCPA